MLKRLYFPLVVLFWAIMNILLWRSEMSGRSEAGSALPVAVVWDRIVSAPDSSSLELLRDGQKIGYVRWIPTAGEANASQIPGDVDPGLEGRVRGAVSYTLQVEGNLRLAELPQTVRFTGQAELTTNQVWRRFHFRLGLRPAWIDVKGDFEAGTVEFAVEGTERPFARTFSLAELRQPDVVLASLGLPWAGPAVDSLVGQLGLPDVPGPGAARPITLGLEWQAQNDWMRIGEARARVYRLQARLFDQYGVVMVSRVGELLRIELPGGIVLVNEALQNLGGRP